MKLEQTVSVSATEEVDEFIDQNIQINSNKQMRMEYLHPWTLKFKDVTQEAKYCQLREDMFRSNMLCVFIVWIFIVLCQVIIIPKCWELVICKLKTSFDSPRDNLITILLHPIGLILSTIILTGGCLLVMAEEFSGLPIFLQKSSAMLAHHRDYRTLFICSIIILMSAASSVGLFLCPMAQNRFPTGLNHTNISHTPSPLNLTNYDNEIRLDVHISAIIHRNMSNDAKSTAPVNASKLNQFSSRDLNTIRSEFDKIVNKTMTNSSSKRDDDFFLSDGNNTIIMDNNDFDDIFSPPIVDGSIIIADQYNACSHPEYLVFTWVLCLIALATGLKLYYLVKTFMAIIMVCCYAILILIVFPDVFASASTESEENLKYGMPLTARMNILLIVFLTMVTYHARLVEVTSRLDFIWKEQAEKELTNMKSNRNLNDLLIKVCIFRSKYINFSSMSFI